MTRIRQPLDSKERTQRVRIGLTGLASVFLLVIFAAAVLGFVRNEPAIVTDARGDVVIANAASPANEGDTPKEPLAELGVTPGNTPGDPVSNSQPGPAQP